MGILGFIGYIWVYLGILGYIREDGEDNVTLLPGEGESLTPSPSFINDVKKDVKCQVLMEENETSRSHVQTLIKQSRFLELTQVEQRDATWKSFINNLP